MTSVTLKKWDVVKVYRPDLSPPHDKYCICICPVRLWFFYINSDPPVFRKKRLHAIDVANHELLCLTKPVSYIDTMSVITDLPSSQLHLALIQENGRNYGPIPPTLREKIIATAKAHGALSPAEIEAVTSN